MTKKTFTENELQTLTAEEINHKIIYENYSLLKSLGGEKLRREMIPVGKVCRTAVNLFLATSGPKKDVNLHSKNAQKKLVKILSKLTPGEYGDFPSTSGNGLVVGFNHPSLGEIARIMTMKIEKLGDKMMLFPVNLPWYEALAKYYDKIKMLGIIITPTITPSTWNKLNIKEGTPLFDSATRIKREFRDMYTSLSQQVLDDGGVLFVAPSATRQAKVFKTPAVYRKEEDVIPTMAVLALRVLKDPAVKCDFLPMGVLPPKNYKRGLNLHKKYKLIPGKIFTAEEIRTKYFNKDGSVPEKLEGFDWDFHKRIADTLPKEFWY